ncbi:hypothetical protein ACFPVX_21890 [Cohnella faecalis]|uniref:WxL domain-containing protein n=1 Tax=Cohnella faecalis TaxID=2315694 RepID=A0A398CHT2_9BACL|nr:hypothetical protein [Cohnella faecalis]RIE00438.1 hypothetical protein D3H35_28945 [Cohnella faecalis]
MNKGLLKIFAILTLVFSFVNQPATAAVKTIKVKVSLVSVELIENNHVGNEWYTSGSVNGKEIVEGSSVILKLKPAESVKLRAYAEEQDKIPDSGSSDSSIKASSISKKISKALTVTVTENRGRYSGNTANWKFVFEIQKQ